MCLLRLACYVQLYLSPCLSKVFGFIAVVVEDFWSLGQFLQNEKFPWFLVISFVKACNFTWT